MTSSVLSTFGSPAEIRLSHLKHEASVKSIGILYYIGSLVFVFAIFAAGSSDGEVASRIGVAAVLGGLALVYFQIGRWLRQLNPKAQIPATLIALIGLLGFPVGTLVSGYILYLLRSQKGKTVFSEEYRQIISETPEIKYRTSIIVWIFVALLLFLIGFIALAVLLRPNVA